MKKVKIILQAIIVALFCLLAIAGAQDKPENKSAKSKHKKVCITFDNLPAESNYNHDERQFINSQILAILKEFKIPAAGFVVGENIEGDWKLVVDWLDAGLTVGFSTYSGQDIENVPDDVFTTDIKKGSDTIEDLLQTYRQKGRYFRFPFLHYGRAPEYRRKIKDILAAQKIKIAHVTILTEDFVYNLALEKNLPSGDSTRLDLLRQEYVDHIIEQLARAERLARDAAGRPVRHILQLRVNRLNAFFLKDVLLVFEERGYNFVSLGHALNDKIYKTEDKYNGAKSISFLERLKYSK